MNPTQSEIDELHQRYTDTLVELYNSNRSQYAPDPNVDLEIV